MKEYYTDYSYVYIFTDIYGEPINKMEFASDKEAEEYLNEE